MAIAGLPEGSGEKMRAAVYYGKKDIRIETVSKPICKDDEVLVKVAFNGICGTDLHEYEDGANFHPKAGCPHPVSGLELPLVIGHEFSGTVTEVGKNLTDKVKVGQNLCVQPDFGCGECAECKADHRNTCAKMGFIGLSGPPGGLGQYMTVKPENYHILPDNVPLDAGAMIEPLAVAWHATRIGKVKPEHTCLVIGSGPIGAFVIRSLKAQNVKHIICAEVAKQRQDIAIASGADTIVNPVKEDVAEACRKATNGLGVDVAFDAAGLANGATLKTAIQSTRPSGTITNIAIYAAPVPFDIVSLYMGERTLNGIIGYTKQDFIDVIKAVSEGRIKTDDMCTAKIKLDDLVDGGFKELLHNKEAHVKILVQHDA